MSAKKGSELKPGDSFRSLGQWMKIIRVHQEGGLERTFICELEGGTRTYRSVLRSTNYKVKLQAKESVVRA